jgi:competence protein ComEC
VLLPQVNWRILGPKDPNGSIKKLAIRWVVAMWITGACAWFIATPLIAHVFGNISPSGLVSNIPSIFLLTLIIILGVFKSLLVLALPEVEQVVTLAFSMLLQLLIKTAELCGNLPHGFINVTPITWVQSLLIIAWIVLWSTINKRRYLLWITAPLLIIAIKHSSTTNETTITTINVGHGTCHIIANNDNAVVIDAGSRNNLDVGVTTIIPKLKSLGIKNIEIIFITHADLDHLAGIIDIIQSYKTQAIVIAPQTLEHITEPLKKIVDIANTRKIPVVEGVAGWRRRFRNMCFTIISPDKDDEYYSSNASSLVVCLQAHGKTVLFTGDIDEKKIKQVSNMNLGTIDVLELPHHGQWSQESQSFIDKKRPKIVLQSTSISRHKKDRWTFPIKSIRLVTAIDGTITTTLYENGTISSIGSNSHVTMEPCTFQH